MMLGALVQVARTHTPQISLPARSTSLRRCVPTLWLARIVTIICNAAEPHRLCLQFTGNDGVTVNFYTSFCSDGVHNKPFIITETSSEYLPSGSGGTSDLEIKQVWWEQVYNIQVIRAARCPRHDSSCSATVLKGDPPRCRATTRMRWTSRNIFP